MYKIALIGCGPQNYGLDDLKTKYNYKLLALPTFEDMFWNEPMKLPKGYDLNNISPLDIREFNTLVQKGYYDAIELLFSNDIEELACYPFFKRWLASWRGWYEHGYGAYVYRKLLSSLKDAAIQLMANNPTEKEASRAWYFAFLANQIVNDGFIINKESWRNEKLIEIPRAILVGDFKGFDWRDQERLLLKFKQAEVNAIDKVEAKDTSNYFSASILLTQDLAKTAYYFYDEMTYKN